MNKPNMMLLAALTVTASWTGAQAQRLTAIPAARFYQTCQSRGGQTVCDAYISGVADGVTLAESSVGKGPDGKPKLAPTICIPSLSGTELRGRVTGWLSAHTDRLKGDVGPAVHDAMAELFPCAAGAGRE